MISIVNYGIMSQHFFQGRNLKYKYEKAIISQVRGEGKNGAENVSEYKTFTCNLDLGCFSVQISRRILLPPTHPPPLQKKNYFYVYC